MPAIAIIEDEIPIAQLYKLKFEIEGFTVHVAHDGMRGLQLIKSTQPDLVLLDLRMPRMNGDEMLMNLRGTKWGADVRVVILTNLSRQEAPASLRLLNVERYVVKANHTPAQVVAIVREVLGLTRT